MTTPPDDPDRQRDAGEGDPPPPPPGFLPPRPPDTPGGLAGQGLPGQAPPGAPPAYQPPPQPAPPAQGWQPAPPPPAQGWAPAPESPAAPQAPPQGYGQLQAPAGWAPPGGAPPGGTWGQPGGYAAAGPGSLAGWGTRAGAAIIDGLIVFVPAMILLFAFGAGVASTDEDSSGFGALVGGLVVSVLIVVVVSLLYAPLLMKRSGERNGQTWGKQLLNIRVVRDNGQPFTFGSAALREVLLKNLAVGLASSVIPILPWFLNFFWPLWDEQNRALHDMAASTHVVSA